jgi:hypothetical protein
VSGDGKHIVGLRIKLPVNCQRGYYLSSFGESFFSYGYSVTITNHIAREAMETAAGGEYKVGHIGMYLLFTAPGTLEGRLRIHIPMRGRAGICAATLKFTAKI